MKRWQTLLIGLMISALFLYLALRRADFLQMLGAFRTARYSFVALTFLAVVLIVLLRGLRWSILTGRRLATLDSFWLFNIGFLFNNVLPVRLGEFARAALAGRRPGMHFTSALSSIVVERLFDMVSVVLLVVIALVGLPLPGWAATAGAVMGAVALAGIALLAAAARRPEWALETGSRLLAILPRLTRDRAHKFLRPFVHGLGGVSDPRTFAAGLGLSILAWLFSGFSAWVLMLAFWSHVPLIAGIMAVAAAGLGIAIPAAPAGVGPYEAAVIGVLTATGYNADISRSYAFALHAVNFAVTCLFGAIGLLREGVSFGQVAREAQALRSHPGAEQITGGT
jgi:hypothetical protein